jgi:hypothetical protein
MSRRSDARSLLERLRTAIAGASSNNYSNLDAVFNQYIFAPINVSSAVAAGFADYLRKHWLDPNSQQTYFPGFQPIAPIAAQGILKTLDLSLANQPNPKPIDAWWLVDHPDFRVVNLVSPQQVTLLIQTPRPPISYTPDIWSGTAEAYTTGRLVVTQKFEGPSQQR